MSKRRIWAIVSGLVLACVVGVVLLRFAAGGWTSEDFQTDADLARLQDLKAMGGWLAEYQTKQGKYPFQGAEPQPVYVFVSTREQEEYTQPGPPVPYVRKPLREFVAELERGIGHKIEVPFDPQRVPVNKPNFYMYAVEGGTYNFAVHLHGPFSFARELGPHYFKLGISNRPNPSIQIWAYEDLEKDAGFTAALARAPLKPGYMDALRKKLRQSEGF